MADVAVTNTFTNNTTADGNQVTTNFADLVNYINARNGGSSAWDVLKVTTATAVPLVVNNSSGSSNIANFQDNGSNVLSIGDGGATSVSATAGGSSVALTVDNSTSTGSVAVFKDNGTAVVTIPDGGGITVATAAPSTPTANTLYKDSFIKGWINMNGTGTIAIRDSVNVAAIVDNAEGDYSITWETDFANANYCVTTGVKVPGADFASVSVDTQVVGSVTIKVLYDTLAGGDPSILCAMAIGDQ